MSADDEIAADDAVDAVVITSDDKDVHCVDDVITGLLLAALDTAAATAPRQQHTTHWIQPQQTYTSTHVQQHYG